VQRRVRFQITTGFTGEFAGPVRVGTGVGSTSWRM
jgi:hypothetical protein